MAIGKRGKGRQQELFVAASEIRALGNPFYRALNRLLEEEGFDEFAEETCREFYAEKRGRPGIPPGVYFRMLLVGYLEGIGSERGIAWRCGDSISLREFLGYGLERNPPEHSGLSKTRKRLSVEAHAAVFSRVLEVVQASGLLSGKTLGVDSTSSRAESFSDSRTSKFSSPGTPKMWRTPSASRQRTSRSDAFKRASLLQAVRAGEIERFQTRSVDL